MSNSTELHSSRNYFLAMSPNLRFLLRLQHDICPYHRPIYRLQNNTEDMTKSDNTPSALRYKCRLMSCKRLKLIAFFKKSHYLAMSPNHRSRSHLRHDHVSHFDHDLHLSEINLPRAVKHLASQ